MEENLKTAEQMIYNATEAGSKFICLPEYFSIPSSLENQNSVDMVFKETYEPTMLFLKQASKNVDAYIVGGTLIEKFRGRFYDQYTIVEQEYRDKKANVLMKKSRSTRAEVYKYQRDLLFYIMNEYLKINRTRMVKLCNKVNWKIGSTTIFDAIFKIKRDFLKEE